VEEDMWKDHDRDGKTKPAFTPSCCSI